MARRVAGLVAGLMAAGAVHGDHALAQTDPGALTTREIAQCREATDQPMCLLSIAARHARPSIQVRIALWRAPDLVAELEAVPRPPLPDQPFADGYAPQIYDRASDDYVAIYQALCEAVVAAVELDRGGAPPEEALAPIRALSSSVELQRLPYDGIHLTRPPTGASLRMLAYQTLWNAYAGERGEWPFEQPLAGLSRPSEALARGALAAWEAEWQSGFPRDFTGGGGITFGGELDERATRLAQAYERADDSEGAARARALKLDSSPLSRAVDAMQEDRLDDALEVLGGAEDQCAAPYRIKIGLNTLMAVAVSAERYEMATRIAHEALDCERGSPWPTAAELTAIETIARYGDRAEALAVAERFDAIARTASADMDLIASDEISTAAVAAVTAWRELDRLDRAQELLDIWRPLAEVRQLETDCGTQVWRQCLQNTVIEMLWSLDRLPEALDGLGLTVDEAIRYDARDQLGASRVDYWLDLARTQQERDALLRECVQFSRNDSVRSFACARQLIAEAGRRELTDEQLARVSDSDSMSLGGPYVAAETAFTAAANAARLGGPEAADGMQEMLDAALKIWASVPEARWAHGLSELEQIALGQLRAAGRL